MLGFSSADVLGVGAGRRSRPASRCYDGDGRPLVVARLPGRAALAGEEPPEMLVRSRLLGSRRDRFSLVKARPVLDHNGEVAFAVNVFRDVTERQEAMEALRASESRLAFLASASRRLLNTALEPRQVLEEVAAMAVPELADWCSVREFSEDGRVERIAVGPPGLRGRRSSGRLRRLRRSPREAAPPRRVGRGAFDPGQRGHPGHARRASPSTPSIWNCWASSGSRSVILVPLRPGAAPSGC